MTDPFSNRNEIDDFIEYQYTPTQSTQTPMSNNETEMRRGMALAGAAGVNPLMAGNTIEQTVPATQPVPVSAKEATSLFAGQEEPFIAEATAKPTTKIEPSYTTKQGMEIPKELKTVEDLGKLFSAFDTMQAERKQILGEPTEADIAEQKGFEQQMMVKSDILAQREKYADYQQQKAQRQNQLAMVENRLATADKALAESMGMINNKKIELFSRPELVGTKGYNLMLRDLDNQAKVLTAQYNTHVATLGGEAYNSLGDLAREVYNGNLQPMVSQGKLTTSEALRLAQQHEDITSQSISVIDELKARGDTERAKAEELRIFGTPEFDAIGRPILNPDGSQRRSGGLARMTRFGTYTYTIDPNEFEQKLSSIAPKTVVETQPTTGMGRLRQAQSTLATWDDLKKRADYRVDILEKQLEKAAEKDIPVIETELKAARQNQLEVARQGDAEMGILTEAEAPRLLNQEIKSELQTQLEKFDLEKTGVESTDLENYNKILTDVTDKFKIPTIELEGEEDQAKELKFLSKANEGDFYLKKVKGQNAFKLAEVPSKQIIDDRKTKYFVDSVVQNKLATKTPEGYLVASKNADDKVKQGIKAYNDKLSREYGIQSANRGG